MEELQKLAKEFLALNIERDTLNEKENYKEAFEIECTQREIGSDIATLILNLQGN